LPTVFAVTLATLLVPVLFLLQATDYDDIPLGTCKAHTRYWGGGGCGAPAFLTLSPWLAGLLAKVIAKVSRSFSGSTVLAKVGGSACKT
jgi:hypothetical protein